MTARIDRILFTCLILDLLARRFALDDLIGLPDISISAVNHPGPMTAGVQYELQCDIQNVTKSVDVRWYKGGQNIKNETILVNTTMTPVKKTSKLYIHPSKTDDGAQYRCEVELETEELQSHPKIAYKSLNIIVYYKPVINETKLPSTVPVFRGYPDYLICEAEGNPKPTIRWTHENVTIISTNGTVLINETMLGKINCIANNSVGSVFREVKVVLKEDYLPLIAGLVAITVAFISVIFVFIYSIYYKTSKMGRYSLKDAKPSPQNGNIAQNCKDIPLPMKKLSQINILA